jgi:FkbM family methyltransferase
VNATLTHNDRTATFLDCDKADCIQGHLLNGFWYESALLDVLETLEAAGNYIDIGAYVGTFSVFAGLFCPAKTIYAFEPQVDIHKKLSANIATNGIANCQPINVALGERADWGRMTSDPTNRGGSTLQPGAEVAVAPLDAFGLTDVRVMKIDVEGSELAVLKGGMNTIGQAEFLFVELWQEKTCQAYGIPYTGQQVNELLNGMGFIHQCELPGDSHFYRRRIET